VRHEKNIILFDGICNLCNRSIDFILKRDKKNQFYYVSLQSDEGKKIVIWYKIPRKTDSVILIKKGEVFTESDAAIEVGRLLSFPWNCVVILKVIPRVCRDWVYQWIARNRYRWFGKQENCRIIQN